MLTTAQIKNRTKTVTRRTGWAFLKPGDIVNSEMFQAEIAKKYDINLSTVSRINTNSFRYQKYEMKGA